jgi:Ca2+-binding RTX toxin-like protein
MPWCARFSGGNGRDLLIGGWGRDNVAGQPGDDLLIGGRPARTSWTT